MEPNQSLGSVTTLDCDFDGTQTKILLHRQFLSISKDGIGELSVFDIGSVLHDPTLKMSKHAIAALTIEFMDLKRILDWTRGDTPGRQPGVC